MNCAKCVLFSVLLEEMMMMIQIICIELNVVVDSLNSASTIYSLIYVDVQWVKACGPVKVVMGFTSFPFSAMQKAAML